MSANYNLANVKQKPGFFVLGSNLGYVSILERELKVIHKIGDIIERFIYRYNFGYLNHRRNKKAIEGLDCRDTLNHPLFPRAPEEIEFKSDEIEKHIIEGTKKGEEISRNAVDSASSYRELYEKEQSAGRGNRIYEEFFAVTRRRNLMWRKRGRLLIVVILGFMLYISALWMPERAIPIIGISVHFVTVILLWQNES